MKIELCGSYLEVEPRRWYNGELDEKLKRLEKKINDEISKICEKHKIVIVIKKYHEVELTALIDNTNSIF